MVTTAVMDIFVHLAPSATTTQLAFANLWAPECTKELWLSEEASKRRRLIFSLILHSAF
jgi:hypothetical protein